MSTYTTTLLQTIISPDIELIHRHLHPLLHNAYLPLHIPKPFLFPPIATHKLRKAHNHLIEPVNSPLQSLNISLDIIIHNAPLLIQVLTMLYKFL